MLLYHYYIVHYARFNILSSFFLKCKQAKKIQGNVLPLNWKAHAKIQALLKEEKIQMKKSLAPSHSIESFRVKRAYITFWVDFYFLQDQANSWQTGLFWHGKVSFSNCFCWAALRFCEKTYAKKNSVFQTEFLGPNIAKVDVDASWTWTATSSSFNSRFFFKHMFFWKKLRNRLGKKLTNLV